MEDFLTHKNDFELSCRHNLPLRNDVYHPRKSSFLFMLLSMNFPKSNILFLFLFLEKGGPRMMERIRARSAGILSVPLMGEILYFGLWMTIHDEFRVRSPNSELLRFMEKCSNE